MQLYTIFPPKNINVDFSFNLKGNNKDSILDYFKFNDDDIFLQKPRINLTYDNEFETQITTILNADFYFSSSGILLFSRNFFEIAHDKLKEDALFFPCLINNTPSDIYALYIKNSISFLNNKSLDCYKDMSSKYIFRDEKKPYIYGVTDKFKEMVIENNLKMQFLELYDKDNSGNLYFTLN
ncbi:hypothetical protein [Neisseria dumasiana]|nr:hypothetical protein [Neisseria dumasiana]UOO85451.1 hypothetical protein LVJ88_05640 [Neisseria dumasiana]